MEPQAASAPPPIRTTPAAASVSPALLVLPAAALAGCAALAAEMLWIRGLGRGVGTTHEALASVAGLFLAGLGLGAAVGARRSGTSTRPAMAAAIALVAAGVWIALTPLYLSALPDLHTTLLDGLGAEGDGGLWIALLLALPLVLPASFCLGFAFPFLVRTRVQDGRRTATQTGWVYAMNTVGAVAGVLGTVWLLPELGERIALRAAAGASLLAALLLLIADRPRPAGHGAVADVPLGKGSAAGGEGLALCVSGAAALTAQLAWFRMLQPLAGAHLWGVALLLAPLLTALAVGAAGGGLLADRVRRSELLLPVLLVLAGVCTLLSLPVAGGAPLRMLEDAHLASGGARIQALVVVFLGVVGPASLVFGAALPAAVRVRADASGSTAAAAGRLYGWNTLGALIGSALAGSLLLPTLGAERTLVVAGILPMVAAAALRARIPSRHRMLAAALHLLPLVVLLWPGLVDGLLSSGPTLSNVIAARKPLPPGCRLTERADVDLYSTWFAGTPAARPGEAEGVPLPVFEGRAGRVALLEEPDGVVGLRRGALRESTFDPDLPQRPSATEFALGFLPALMVPDAGTALVIGHGAGWTAEAVLAAGLESVDVAELDDAVLAAARAYRGLDALQIESDPRAHLCRCDGRVLLRRAARRPAGERYDLIVSQPGHPWHPASGHLFTQEAFAAGKAALNEGGVLAQWLNLFDLTPDLLRSALTSFRAVFAQVWVFRFSDEIVMLGFTAQPTVDVAHWEQAFAEGSRGGATARQAGYASAGALWRHLALDTAGVDEVAGSSARTLHDDVPRLELELAWRRLSGAAPEDPAAALARAFPPDMDAALPRSNVRERWLREATESWLADGDAAQADLWSRRLRWGATPDGKAAQAAAALAAGSPRRAVTLLSAALAATPERGDIAAAWMNALGSLPSSDARVATSGYANVRQLIERFPEDGRVLAAAARLHREHGAGDEARALFTRSLEAKAAEAPAGTRAQLARLILSEDHDAEGEKQARALLAADATTYRDLTRLDLLVRLTSQAGEEEQADTLEGALRTLQQTQGLAALRQAAGHLSRHEFPAAVRAARRAAEIWSWQPTAFELAGLVFLAAHAASDADEPATAVYLEEALRAFDDAIERSSDPQAVRARAGRMLRWYGHEPDQLASHPGSREGP